MAAPHPLFIFNGQLLARNMDEFMFHYTTGGTAQLQIKCHNHHISVQLQADIGPHYLGRNLPPRPRPRRPPPGFEKRRGHYPPKQNPLPPKPKPLPPKQNQIQERKVIMDLGARPKVPFDAVGRDQHNTHILDASLRTLALAPLEQIDGASTFSVENAVPPEEATTVTERTEEEKSTWVYDPYQIYNKFKHLRTLHDTDDTAFPFPPTAARAQLEDEAAHSECKPPSTSAGDVEQDFKQGDSVTSAPSVIARSGSTTRDWYSDSDDESTRHQDCTTEFMKKALLEELKKKTALLKNKKLKPRGRLK